MASSSLIGVSTAQDTDARKPILPRLALLIDTENVQLPLVGEIYAKACEFGSPVIRRAYACYTSHQANCWRNSPYARIGATPIHAPSVTKGKNAADISLAIDAIEIAITGKADVVCIATSDGDFSMLGHKLREYGVTVLGIGDRRSPEGWQGACDHFAIVDQTLDEKAIPLPDPDAAPRPPRFPLKAVAKAILEIVDERPLVALSVIGTDLREIDPNFSPKRYGFKKLSGMVSSLAHYGISLVEAEGEHFVRRKERESIILPDEADERETAPAPGL